MDILWFQYFRRIGLVYLLQSCRFIQVEFLQYHPSPLQTFWQFFRCSTFPCPNLTLVSKIGSPNRAQEETTSSWRWESLLFTNPSASLWRWCHHQRQVWWWDGSWPAHHEPTFGKWVGCDGQIWRTVAKPTFRELSRFPNCSALWSTAQFISSTARVQEVFTLWCYLCSSTLPLSSTSFTRSKGSRWFGTSRSNWMAACKSIGGTWDWGSSRAWRCVVPTYELVSSRA